MKEYALFMGCLIPLRIPSVELAARKVFQKLDIKAVDLQGYSCCPDPAISRVIDRKMWLTLSARNLCLAETLGLDIMTLCNGCYETLSEANEMLRRQPESREEINKVLKEFGKKYEGKTRVRKFVEVIYEDVGIDRVKERVERPWRLRTALHYGCHLLRPEEEGEGIWKKPKMMEALVRVVGAEVVDYGLERLCCGYPSMQAEEEFSLKNRLLPKLRSMENAKADCVVVVCPACTVQFEMGQMLLRRYGFQYQLPCIYLPELLALTFGVPAADLSLEFHRSPVKELAQRVEGI